MIANWLAIALDTDNSQELRQAACFLLYRQNLAEMKYGSAVKVNIKNQWVNKQTVTYQITIGERKYVVTLTVLPFCN